MTYVAIGVVGTEVQTATNFSRGQWLCATAQCVLDVVSDYGAFPLVIPPSVSPKELQYLASKLDGLLLAPGRDIDASFYNAEPEVTYGNVDGVGEPGHRPQLLAPEPRRDSLEIALFEEMTKSNKPVLGICRGMQLINIARGGSLHQELPEANDHFLAPDGWVPYHPVNIMTDSRLHTIVGKNETAFSSVHHQGIANLGNDLKVAASAPDGVIEAIEDSNGAFIFGLQSHPEKTRRNFPEIENLFSAFVDAAKVTQYQQSV